MPGKMPRPSGACPMPTTTLRCPGIRLMSLPSKLIRPAVSGRSPEMVFSVVVLPAPWVGANLTRPPLGALLAEVEHRDAVADIHHQSHVVLDEQHRPTGVA